MVLTDSMLFPYNLNSYLVSVQTRGAESEISGSGKEVKTLWKGLTK
ncbi:MAG: hypothetical protein LUE90_08655 [Clostridiales bacterium]|nr:hypothetical protein [Clostridiales bacterium]